MGHEFSSLARWRAAAKRESMFSQMTRKFNQIALDFG
jgi:hypothetical protein